MIDLGRSCAAIIRGISPKIAVIDDDVKQTCGVSFEAIVNAPDAADALRALGLPTGAAAGVVMKPPRGYVGIIAKIEDGKRSCEIDTDLSRVAVTMGAKGEAIVRGYLLGVMSPDVVMRIWAMQTAGRVSLALATRQRSLVAA
jgi:hypothetical protein